MTTALGLNQTSKHPGELLTSLTTRCLLLPVTGGRTIVFTDTKADAGNLALALQET
jgi:hypothetical protein